MAHNFSTTITRFEENIPRSIALANYEEAAVTLAIDVFRDHTPNGLAHIVLSPPAYAARFPNADGTPVVIPDLLLRPAPLADNATSAQIFNATQQLKTFEKHQAAILYIEHQIETNLPTDMRKSIERNFSLRHLTTIQQFEELKRLNPISESDIDLLSTLISSPFTKNENIADFTKRQLRLIDYLKQIGQPLANRDAIQRMFKAHQATLEDQLDFALFVTNYHTKITLAMRTPANYSSEMINFVNEILPSHRTARVALNTANSAAVIPLLPNKGIMETELSANLDNAVAAATKQKAKTHASTVSSTLPPEFPPYWCWSHQNTKTHWSHNCKYPRQGHQRNATKQNPMGAKNS